MVKSRHDTRSSWVRCAQLGIEIMRLGMTSIEPYKNDGHRAIVIALESPQPDMYYNGIYLSRDSKLINSWTNTTAVTTNDRAGLHA